MWCAEQKGGAAYQGAVMLQGRHRREEIRTRTSVLEHNIRRLGVAVNAMHLLWFSMKRVAQLRRLSASSGRGAVPASPLGTARGLHSEDCRTRAVFICA